MEKVAFYFGDEKKQKYLRVVRWDYCPDCDTIASHVEVNLKSLPADMRHLLIDGKPQVVCLTCLDQGNYRGRAEGIFRELSLVDPKSPTEFRLAMAT